MAALTAALIATAVIAAGTQGYNAYQGSQAASQATDEKGRQEQLAAKAAADAKAQSDLEAKQQKQTQDQAAAVDQANVLRLMQQRRRGIGGGGVDYTKGGTLLTGPQGVTGTAPTTTSTKTLLGT